MKFYKIPYIVLILAFTGCNNSIEVNNITVKGYSSLDSIYTKNNAIDSSFIYPIFIKNISTSINNLNVAERKKVFIKSLLSNIIKNNDDILHVRDSIYNILKKTHNNITISDHEVKWLNSVSKTYRSNSNDLNDLLKKVDIIPVSMAIAQSIVESGWGTSRFATEGNSMFGEHFSNGAEGKHISAEFSNVKMKSFTNIYDAVKSYSININRHRAYRRFRDKRIEMRNNSQPLNSLELVETLVNYSEIGGEYTIYLKGIINKNKLQLLDNLKIDYSKTQYLVKISDPDD